jgi:hypothetical protein
MKRTIAIAVVLAFSTTQAEAFCHGFNTLGQQTLATVLANNYVCNLSAPLTWNELHVDPGVSGSGSIKDWKKGPTDPVDPSQTIGTYTVTGSSPGIVTYDYGAPPTYSYTVARNNNDTNTNLFWFCPSPTGTDLELKVQSTNC